MRSATGTTRGRRRRRGDDGGGLPRAPVPERVRLVPSTTAFLPRCANSSIRLSVGPGPVVTLRYAGRPCHVPPLHLRAVVRASDGHVVYVGPALAYEDLSGNYAGEGTAHGPLLGACRARRRDRRRQRLRPVRERARSAAGPADRDTARGLTPGHVRA